MALEDLAPVDAFYFMVVTLATVGYGDVHPVSTEGKVLAMLVIVAGVGTFGAFIVNATGLMLERRQEKARRQRTNALVGLFLSDIGVALLRLLAMFDSNSAALGQAARIGPDWTDTQFADAYRRVKGLRLEVDPVRADLNALKRLLADKADLLMRLLENPTLHEHETFTDLLSASFHLREELMARPTLSGLPDTDVSHLCGDATRVYALLGLSWLDHARYLRSAYPYLFSLAVRLNPLAKEEPPIVR